MGKPVAAPLFRALLLERCWSIIGVSGKIKVMEGWWACETNEDLYVSYSYVVLVIYVS
jgi:hypothetical protein